MSAHSSGSPADSVGILVPGGMLGAGFPAATIARGIALGADVITIDAGSTDSGPHYLGTGTGKNSREALRRDLRMLLRASDAARIPLIVGSCDTSGTDDGVDRVADIVREIMDEEDLHLDIASIYSEQTPGTILEHLRAGRVHPLAPAAELTATDVSRCQRIVAVMGHEPITKALQDGADVVLAGRATDTALSAAFGLMLGMPAGPAWHAAKIMECGGQCTNAPLSGGVFARIDATGFTIEPLDPQASCTPQSVAAHMMYETANPFRMREPAGTLIVSDATYTALDDRRVRVQGSLFEPASQLTIKLEGAALCGFQTMTFSAIRDPLILAQIDSWAARFKEILAVRVDQILDVPPGDYDTDLRLYGYNAVLDTLDPHPPIPQEVGAMLLINAPSQELATAVAKIANPMMLHLPAASMSHLPSFAFAFSPAETERGAQYEFVLNHVVDVDRGDQMFRTRMTRRRHA